MSWDIHGNRLLRGHCEVHPWVHCSYPCPVCLSDAQREEDDRRQRMDYEKEMIQQHTADQLTEHIAFLQQENAALKAQRDELLICCKEAVLQIEHMHKRKGSTASGNTVLKMLNSAIENCK